MLYYLIQFLNTEIALPGIALLNSITFRAFGAVTLSLLISIVYGKRLIQLLNDKQVSESVRDLGLIGQKEKQGTPTMGGLIILFATITPTLLFANVFNIYVALLLISTVFLAVIGFTDDYIKIFKKNKSGLSGKFKVIGQLLVGVFVAVVIYFYPDFIVGIKTTGANEIFEFAKTTKTTLPILKNNEFDYSSLIPFLDQQYTWLVYIPIVCVILVAVSNGANMTDGIDGLSSGTSAIIIFTLTVFVYISGRVDFTNYLNILYIPNLGELTIFCSALLGACIGFLWYNSYPAQVFMGDTGSIMLGGVIAILAFCVRKELLIPVICGVFVLENLSVVMQVGWFKYTKRKYGVGKRIFKMAPLHHHYQKMGVHESKIVTRFFILGVALSLGSLVLLKIR